MTSSLAAFSQIGDRHQFKHAFAGAVIHDIFNVLTTIFLIILEVSTHYLERLTGAIIEGIKSKKAKKVDTLKVITQPLVERIIRLDKNNCWGIPESDLNTTSLNHPQCNFNATSLIHTEKNCKDAHCRQKFIFSNTTLKDSSVGAILFICSLVVICACLIFVVKILNSVLKGKIAGIIKKVAHFKIPHCHWMTGYLSILVGTVSTFLLQSSSVFTSALTPLVGFGVISIEIMYPLTLGANVGTTTTAIIAAFTVEKTQFHSALQAALCHLFFNVTGIVFFYPIPFMRWPIFIAKRLGRICSEYRLFALVYIITSFMIIPGIFLGLSFAGDVYVYSWTCFCGVLIAFVVIVNFLQKKCPKCLSKCMRTWDWLPKPLRSFQPYNDCLVKGKCCRKIHSKSKTPSHAQVTETNFQKYVGRGPSNISLISFSIERDSNKSHTETKNHDMPMKLLDTEEVLQK